MKSTTSAQPERTEALSWAMVLALLGGATLAGFLLDHPGALTSQALLYVLAVVVASHRLAWRQSLACAIGAALALNYFFVPPRYTLLVDSREHLVAIGVMLVVALVISRLATKLRVETETAQRNLRRAGELRELATQLSGAHDAQSIAHHGQQALLAAFPGTCLLAMRQPDGSLALPATLDSHDADGLRCAMREHAILGPGTGRWPGLDAWFFPVGRAPAAGAAVVRPAMAGDSDGREHAQALCNLVGQALLRAALAQEMRAAQLQAERQQLQSTYLAAISHDLRTPLAAVVGAATSLQLHHDKLDPRERHRLLETMVVEAQYLSTLTENTLQLVRLDNTRGDLDLSWEAVEEIVGAVLARVRQRDTSRRIRLKVPPSLPLMQAEPVLLAQVLENLLDNALRYTEGDIDLSVQVRDGELQISVKDRGPDIAPELQDRIFEPHLRHDRSGQHGTGLGLTLCRAIATAHHGRITLRRRHAGGNCFTLHLPVPPEQPAAGAP